MATFNVANSTQLAAALTSAQGGDRIVLAAGSYGDLRLTNRTYTGNVEIVSADPTQPASFRTIFLTSVTNLSFKSIEVGYTLAPNEPNFAKYVNLDRSSRITFDSVHFHGSLDGDASNDGNGFSALNSSFLKIVNSHFEQLGRGILIGSSTDLEVLNNRFHHMRSDGADFSNVQRVLIAGNHFTDFFPVGDDHPDAIQFWSYGQTTPSTDIVIRDNIILQGSGRGLQGIFLKDEVGNLPYDRVVIGNNLVYVNDGLNGITIQGGRNAVVQNNTIVSQRGDAYNHFLRMEDVNGLVLKDNVSDTIINDRNTNVYLINNVRLDQTPAKANEIRDLQAGAAATPEGLALPSGGGYRPEGTPPLLDPPRIGDASNNGFMIGPNFGTGAFVDGLGGTDAIAIQGNYPNLRLGEFSLQNIETFSILTGADARFGDTANNRYSYNVTTVDANVRAGAQLKVIAAELRAGESFTFDGSAETDGKFMIYGGRGTDNLTGGAKNDSFFMADGRMTVGDRFNGGAGTDVLVLRGDYAAANAIVMAADTLTSIETITAMSAADTRFMAGGARYSYDLTMHDANLAAGATMTVTGGQLTAEESLRFNGGAESDGNYRIFGGAGNDIIIAGAGNDFIYGGLGRDRLTGGAGSDTFQYRKAADSTGVNCDQLVGFDCRTDKIDAPGDLAGFTDVLDRGSLSAASFDADLGAALDGLLGAGEAALFTANAGDMAGRVFIVADLNGQAGYQVGQDLVIELVDPLVPINPSIDIFT